MTDLTELFRMLPEPVYDRKPELVDFYHFAWKLVGDHLTNIPGMPCNPYMDEAFCRTQIWIWDTVFMSFFCRYSGGAFPGVESFSNFYDVMYGSKTLPAVVVPENEPRWTGYTPGTMVPIKIHIADNPPLFAWAEYENVLFSGDTDRGRKVLPLLEKHYDFLENLREPFHAEWLLCESCWRADTIGYHWEGGRAGMDNTPRGRKDECADRTRPAGPELLWLDALSQQALAAGSISRLHSLLGNNAAAEVWSARKASKAKLLQKYYFDAEDGCFYDISAESGAFCKVPTIASFWPLTAGCATSEQAEAMLQKLEDPMWFGGKYPFVSLARRDADFVEHGGAYWRGGVWLPTAYATLCGLRNYGMENAAVKYAKRLLDQMFATFENNTPHTIWEAYSPSAPKPALSESSTHRVRKDFCGWSALGPVCIFIEYVIGIHSVDVFRRKVCWTLDRENSKPIGLRNLRFGTIQTTLIAADGFCEVTSNEVYTLEINQKSYVIAPGTTRFQLQ